MKDKNYYKKMAKKLNDIYPNTTSETGVEIVAGKDAIEIRPSKQNTTGVFYSPDVAVDFARLYHLSLYVTSEVTDDGKHLAVAYLF